MSIKKYKINKIYLFICGCIVALLIMNPNITRYLILGPISSSRNIVELLTLTAPLMIAGLGFTLILQSGKINLSGEGSFILGGLTAAIVGTQLVLSPVIHPIAAIAIAGIVGGLVSLLCALVNEYLKTDIIIVSLIINYIAFYFSNYLLTNHLRDPDAGMVVSKEILKTARLPQISGILDISIILAITMALLIYFLLFKTRFGIKLRIVGDNINYAKNLGINTEYVQILAQFIGGCMSGVAGGVYLLSAFKRFNWLSMPGFGWDAVLVALMGRKNPLAVILSSLLIAYLRTGMNILSRHTGISPDITMIIQGVVLIIILMPKKR